MAQTRSDVGVKAVFSIAPAGHTVASTHMDVFTSRYSEPLSHDLQIRSLVRVGPAVSIANSSHSETLKQRRVLTSAEKVSPRTQEVQVRSDVDDGSIATAVPGGQLVCEAQNSASIFVENVPSSQGLQTFPVRSRNVRNVPGRQAPSDTDVDVDVDVEVDEDVEVEVWNSRWPILP